MAFVARLDDKGLHAVLVCDAAGCGKQIEYEVAPVASIVAVPPKDGEPTPVQFACSAACEGALMVVAGNGAGALDLTTWWEATAVVLGFDDDDDDASAMRDADDFLEALDALEVLVQRPGIPAGMTVRDAVGLGYIGRLHVVAALPGSS